MGYESKLIIGEVHGRHGGRPEDPAPMWMNPIVTLDLSKMGYDNDFARLREKAKTAGVFLYRAAHFDTEQHDALEMAEQVILQHAPPGAFEHEVAWMKQLQVMIQDRMLEEPVHEDSYGVPFKRMPFRETAAACRAIFEEDERGGYQGYRRALLATVTLEHFIQAIEEGRWGEYQPEVHGTEPHGQIMLIHEGY